MFNPDGTMLCYYTNRNTLLNPQGTDEIRVWHENGKETVFRDAGIFHSWVYSDRILSYDYMTMAGYTGLYRRISYIERAPKETFPGHLGKIGDIKALLQSVAFKQNSSLST